MKLQGINAKNTILLGNSEQQGFVFMLAVICYLRIQPIKLGYSI